MLFRLGIKFTNWQKKDNMQTRYTIHETLTRKRACLEMRRGCRINETKVRRKVTTIPSRTSKANALEGNQFSKELLLLFKKK
jgi:hypothetical protein